MPTKKAMVLETAFSTYTTEQLIGEGGAGRVFRAKDESGETVAAKILDPSKANSEKKRRFRNEINFCFSCRHPNIVPILDHGVFKSESGAAPFYIMPLYSCSLRTLINRGIPPGSVLNYFAKILDGVEAVHLLGGVHRDVKPENILVDENTNAVVIADFGIARFTEEFIVTDVKTTPASRLANFQYAAPEQRIRGGVVDARADIYALGLILNEMFTRQLAVGTDYATIASLAPSLAYLDDVVARMLRQKPDERPSTIEQVKQELVARGSEFITRQRISQLKQEVVPVTDLDDPLIVAPPRLVGFDWDRGTLTLTLSATVNPKWVWAFQNMGNYSSVWGKGPEAFRFSGNKATVAAQEHEVQQVIDHFKPWLPTANRVYEQRLRVEKREVETAALQRTKDEIAEQERRQRVLKSVKI